MRTITALALLTISVAISAAELEQITTTDGRRLIGMYDEIAGIITLDGPGAVKIPLRKEQVRERAPYFKADPAVAKEATTNGKSPQPKTIYTPEMLRKADEELGHIRLKTNGWGDEYEAAKKQHDEKHLQALGSIFPGAVEAINQRRAMERQIESMKEEMAKVTLQAVVRIGALKDADDTTSPDPKQSEAERAKRARDFNGVLHRARYLVKRYNSIKETRSAAIAEADHMLSDQRVIVLLVEFAQ